MDIRLFGVDFDSMVLLSICGAMIFILACVLMYMSFSMDKKLGKSPMVAGVKLKKMRPGSATRQRLERSAQLFKQGWKLIKPEGGQPHADPKCLELFAQAVEIDEIACGWKAGMEEKLELVGALFEQEEGKDLPPTFTSMLAEAYLVLLLCTVVALYGKQSDDAVEDFSVVKSRLDTCAKLQPNNPAVYKLRGDWVGCRFPLHASKAACKADFERAIRLCEEHPDGSNLNTHGVDRAAQRSYTLAFCHFKLGEIAQHAKDFEAARKHYEAVLEHADADFVSLPDAYFNLTVLLLLRPPSAGGSEDDGPVPLSQAVKYFQKGVEASKKLKVWYPSANHDVSRKLAEGLITRTSRLEVRRQTREAAVDKKTK